MKTNITTLGNVLSILVVLCTQLLEKKNADNVISTPLLNIGYMSALLNRYRTSVNSINTIIIFHLNSLLPIVI